VASRIRRKNSLLYPRPKAPPSYRDAHWGRPVQEARTLAVSEPGDNEKLIGLGPLLSVVYVTQKGDDDEPVEYEHTFKESNPPLLAYGSDDGKLYIVGGGYYMTKHGIVD
jgi:hypothetical protein